MTKRRSTLASVYRNFWEFVGLVVLLFAILSFVRLLWGGVPLPAGLSVGSLLALLGGTLAFLAVMIQIDAGKQARREEGERRARALASALIAEIEDFKQYHIEAFINQTAGDRVGFHGHEPFSVYRANAGRIGEFDESAARTVAHFYDLADELLGAERRYREIVNGQCFPSESYEEKLKRETDFFAKQILAKLRPLGNVADSVLCNLRKAGSFQ